MATLHVRNVPDQLYLALRRCAEAEGRSIGAQAVFLLERALMVGDWPRPRRGRRRGRMRLLPFERFTERGRTAIRLAQDEARDLGHNYVGTEHLLLGVLRDEEGPTAQALRRLGIDLEGIRAKVEENIGRGEEPPAARLSFTPRTKKILELALREAMSLRHNYIGTEHILLALVEEGEGVAAQILRELGADAETVRGVVIAGLTDEPEPPAIGDEPQYLAVDLEGSAEQWTERLDDLAGEGWELVSLQQHDGGTRAVLRRPE